MLHVCLVLREMQGPGKMPGGEGEMTYTGDCLDILPTLEAESVQCMERIW